MGPGSIWDTYPAAQAVGKVIRSSAHLGPCTLGKRHTWFRSQRKWLQGGSLVSSLACRTHLWSSKRPKKHLRLVQGHPCSSSHPGFWSLQQIWEGPWEKHKGEGDPGVRPKGKRETVAGVLPFVLGKLPFRASKEGGFDNHGTSPLDSPRLVWLIAKPSGGQLPAGPSKSICLLSLCPSSFLTSSPGLASGTLSPRILAGQIWFHAPLPVYSHRAIPRLSFVLNPPIFHCIREDPNLLRIWHLPLHLPAIFNYCFEL